MHTEERDAGTAHAAAIGLGARLGGWLREAALPLWSREGYDRMGGGFAERLTAGSAVGAGI